MDALSQLGLAIGVAGSFVTLAMRFLGDALELAVPSLRGARADREGWRELGTRDGVTVCAIPASTLAPVVALFVAAPHLRLEVTRRPQGRARGDSGDPAFDERVSVSGPEIERRALLDSGARAALQRLVDAGGEVRDGRVVIGWAGEDEPAVQGERVGLLVDVVRRLQVAGEPLARVEAVALGDPRPGVQEACLGFLLRASRPRGLAAAARLAAAGRGGVRLVALRAAGRAEDWLALARDPSEPAAARAEAVGRLDPASAATASALVDALRGPDVMVEAALALLAGPAGEGWAPTLASLAHAAWVGRDDRWSGWSGGRRGAALARAFAAWARAEDEDVLVTLAHQERGVAGPALDALARVGSTRVLDRLPAGADAVRAAVLSRHTGPGAGALSLAGGGGEVSLPDRRAGAVSRPG